MKSNQLSITFVVTEDANDGGFVAQAHWPDGNRDIITQGDDRQELIRNIREALGTAFAPKEPRPKLIHLHFVRDEVIAA